MIPKKFSINPVSPNCTNSKSPPKHATLRCQSQKWHGGHHEALLCIVKQLCWLNDLSLPSNTAAPTDLRLPLCVYHRKERDVPPKLVCNCDSYLFFLHFPLIHSKARTIHTHCGSGRVSTGVMGSYLGTSRCIPLGHIPCTAMHVLFIHKLLIVPLNILRSIGQEELCSSVESNQQLTFDLCRSGVLLSPWVIL